MSDSTVMDALGARIKKQSLVIAALTAENSALRSRIWGVSADPFSGYVKELEEQLLQRNLEAKITNDEIAALKAALSSYEEGVVESSYRMNPRLG